MPLPLRCCSPTLSARHVPSNAIAHERDCASGSRTCPARLPPSRTGVIARLHRPRYIRLSPLFSSRPQLSISLPLSHCQLQDPRLSKLYSSPPSPQSPRLPDLVSPSPHRSPSRPTPLNPTESSTNPLIASSQLWPSCFFLPPLYSLDRPIASFLVTLPSFTETEPFAFPGLAQDGLLPPVSPKLLSTPAIAPGQLARITRRSPSRLRHTLFAARSASR